MTRDVLLIKAEKRKPREAAVKKTTPFELAKRYQQIGHSNNFANDSPRKVRDRNTAEVQRELYRRWILYATAAIVAQYAFGVQSAINLRTIPYKDKGGAVIPEPTSGSDTGTSVNIVRGGAEAQSASLDLASWYEDTANALSWLNPFAFGNSPDSDYRPSAWPLQGGDAASAPRRYKVTRRPAENHHHHHEHHHHHHHHGANHDAVAAPEPLLNQILGNIITRRELGEFLMRMNGLDPHALYNHTARPVWSESFKESKPGIDLYIESQKTEWFTRNYYSPEIEALPNLDDIFWDMIDSVQLQAKHNITHKLSATAHHRYNFPKSGGGGTYTLKAIRLTELIDRELGKTDTSSIGYVVDVEDYVLDRTESYVFAPAHEPPLIQIPTNENEQIKWLNQHEKLFFNTKSRVPKRQRTISTEEINRYANLPKVIDGVADYLSQDIVNAFKNNAFDETRRERMINHLQWHVPFYAAWVAYKRHEHTEAVVRGVLDVIALAGGPFARALKTAGIAMKHGRLVHIANQVKKIGYVDLPGQVDGLKKKALTAVGGKIGGGAGRQLADFIADEINQSPQHNSLNQLVDGANSGRGTNQNQIDGVARNT